MEKFKIIRSQLSITKLLLDLIIIINTWFLITLVARMQRSKNTKDTNIIALELSISNKIGLNVDIQNNKRNKGKISFEYKDLDQLNKIIEIIKSNY